MLPPRTPAAGVVDDQVAGDAKQQAAQVQHRALRGLAQHAQVGFLHQVGGGVGVAKLPVEE
ncbi:hypothetical protein D3C76_1609790 [compost metagenome]